MNSAMTGWIQINQLLINWSTIRSLFIISLPFDGLLWDEAYYIVPAPITAAVASLNHSYISLTNMYNKY